MKVEGELAQGSNFAGDEYEIRRPLDAGGQGSVYVALQKSTGQERALKIMRSHLITDPKMRKLFEQEVRIGALIESDHVVQVVGAGVSETGIPWLAMELLKGQVLSKRLDEHQTMSASELLELCKQLCHALAAAHRKNIVHRDLKPENIFLAEPRMSGVPFLVKILDFGIAKIIASNATVETGGTGGTGGMGTPEWMAPEQSDGKANITAAADVWALGLVVFRALTGYHYHRAANESPIPYMPIMREVLFEPLVPASARANEYKVGSRITRELDAWFARCIVREVDQRFKDAGEAYSALKAALRSGDMGSLDGTPVPPKRQSVPPEPRVTMPYQPPINGGMVAPQLPAAPERPLPVPAVGPAPPAMSALLPKLAAAVAVGAMLLVGWWAAGRISAARDRKLCLSSGSSSRARLLERTQACLSACERGSHDLCIRRGDVLLEYRPAGSESGEEARHAYRYACDKGMQEGCKKLAVLLAGIEHGQREAAQIWNRLCDLGDIESCAEEGLLLLGMADPQAIKRLQRACDSSIKRACDAINQYRESNPDKCETKERCAELAERLEKSNRDASVKAYRRGCELKSASSCHYVAQHFTSVNDSKTAGDYRTRACDLGMKEDCSKPGRIVPVAQPGGSKPVAPKPKPSGPQKFPVDEHMERCNEGQVTDCLALGKYFADRDKPDQAINYLNKACHVGLTEACQIISKVRQATRARESGSPSW